MPLFSFVRGQPTAVHRQANNEYSNFVNVHTFLNSSKRRQDAVKEAQVAWNTAKQSLEKRRDLYRVGIAAMQKVKHSIITSGVH